MGAFESDEARAEAIARQWLERYGVVARDWWRHERPPVSWRAIYHELRRLEYRGEIRRGYFVKGLGGAQFALPHAVEGLRQAPGDDDAPIVVMAASDPANPYSLRLESIDRDPLSRPRGAGALLVMRAGRIIMNAEGRGRMLSFAADVVQRDATEAAALLAMHLTHGEGSIRRSRGVRVETIDGRPALNSPHVPALQAAGFRREATGLRFMRNGFEIR
jgi:ATP-dependent Lhr-like helicase